MSAVYQLKIALKYSKPSIWRRIVVHGNTNLAVLHDIIQMTMGWEQAHLFCFDDGKNRYGWVDPDFDDGYMLQAEDVKLDDFLKEIKDTLIYEYDFGDGWEHSITLEKIFTTEEQAVVPKCLKAVNACPPEDCGGMGGYYYLLDILENPKHEDYKNMREWLGLKRGQSFDPSYVSVAEINEYLAEFRA